MDVTYIGPPPAGHPNAAYVTRTERNGLVVRTICSHCNRQTGGSYGTAYKNFVEQFAMSGSLDAGQMRTWISLRSIQPLRVLKQMTSMFLSSQERLNLSRWEALRAFALRKDAALPPNSLLFYLYRIISPYGRVVSLSGMTSIYRRFEPLTLAEIAWPPLGIVYALAPHPLLNSMTEITNWGRYRFRDQVDFAFNVPQLKVASHYPLGFGSEESAQAWAEQNGVITALIRGDATDGSFPMPVLTRSADLRVNRRGEK